MNPQDKLLHLSVIQRLQIINSNLVPLNSKPRITKICEKEGYGLGSQRPNWARDTS